MLGMKWLVAVALSMTAAAPAAAQDVAGILRTKGTVMVSDGGEFVRASDGQSVTAGMRLMIGDDGSATVEYRTDCKTSYNDAGTYTIVPRRCDDNDRKSRQEDAREDGTSAAGDGSLLADLAIIGGAAVGGAIAIDQMGDDVPPDRPVSR